MSVKLTNYYNNIPVVCGKNSKSVSCKADHEETKGFDIPFLGTKSQLPSFIGKAYTREEFLQSVNDEVKRNQGKKMTLTDMVKSAHLEGTRAKFRFVGDTKIYTFDERNWIKEQNNEQETDTFVVVRYCGFMTSFLSSARTF